MLVIAHLERRRPENFLAITRANKLDPDNRKDTVFEKRIISFIWFSLSITLELCLSI